MRPLLITPLFPPAVGGAATYFRMLAADHLRSGEFARIVLLTERLPGRPAVEEQGDGRLVVLRAVPGRVSRPAASAAVDLWRYMRAQAHFALQLTRIVRRERIDLIHYHARFRGPLFHRALRRCGVPVIADLRDKLTDPANLGPYVDALITSAESVYSFAIDSGFPEAKITPLAMPFIPPDSPESTDFTEEMLSLRPFFLFAGEISKGKGVPELVEAFQAFKRERPEYELVLIGPPRLPDTDLERLQNEGGVRLLAPMPQHILHAWMAHSEVVVLPSRSEALSRVVLEAIALGTKVIAPGGIPEFERHLPDYVLPRVDGPSILAMLRRVVEDPQAPTYPFAHHDVGPIGEQTRSLYRKLAEGITTRPVL